MDEYDENAPYTFLEFSNWFMAFQGTGKIEHNISLWNILKNGK